VWSTLSPRNETGVDGMEDRSTIDLGLLVNEIWSFHVKSNLVSVGPKKTLSIDLFCTSVIFKKLLFNAEELDPFAFMWMTPLSFTFP
jgi:hypothetical protein